MGCHLLFRATIDVNLTEENQVVVAAGQELPNGPELAHVDPTVLGGQKVVIEKVVQCKKK